MTFRYEGAEWLEGVWKAAIAPKARGPRDLEEDVKIRELVSRFPLPSHVEDAEMNQAMLAPSLNTTLPTLSRWMKEPGFPIAQEGGNGRPYIFRLSHCYAWMRAREEKENFERDRLSRVQQQMQAHFLNLKVDDSQTAMTAKQRREHADADFAHSRAAQMRRRLVPLEDVHALLQDLITAVREGHEALSDRLEREMGLTPAQVGMVRRASRDGLQALHDRIEAEQLAERDIEDVDPSPQLLI